MQSVFKHFRRALVVAPLALAFSQGLIAETVARAPTSSPATRFMNRWWRGNRISARAPGKLVPGLATKRKPDDKDPKNGPSPCAQASSSMTVRP